LNKGSVKSTSVQPSVKGCQKPSGAFTTLRSSEGLKYPESASLEHDRRSPVRKQLGGHPTTDSVWPWGGYRGLSHFFLRPKVALIIDEFRKEQWKRDVPLLQANTSDATKHKVGVIRQLTVVVFNRGAYPLEKATVHIHVLKKKKRRFFQRVGSRVGLHRWQFFPDVMVAWDSDPAEVVFESTLRLRDEQAVAKHVRELIHSDYETTINARYERIATVLFTVQGHSNAYLANSKATTLPLGQDFHLLISVSGLYMPSTTPQLFRLNLKDWNDFSLKKAGF